MLGMASSYPESLPRAYDTLSSGRNLVSVSTLFVRATAFTFRRPVSTHLYTAQYLAYNGLSKTLLATQR